MRQVLWLKSALAAPRCPTTLSGTRYTPRRTSVSPAGLRTQHTSYERLFLIGNDAWTDYQITVPITIHAVDTLLGPYSGDNGLGVT